MQKIEADAREEKLKVLHVLHERGRQLGLGLNPVIIFATTHRELGPIGMHSYWHITISYYFCHHLFTTNEACVI